jgi:hypothetical protein
VETQNREGSGKSENRERKGSGATGKRKIGKEKSEMRYGIRIGNRK